MAATKIKVPKGGGETTNVIKAPNTFQAWGSEADNAQGEGWRPAESNPHDGTTIFRNTYNPGANTIMIPGDKNYGHLAAIGYKNGQFDIVIRDANGAVRQTIKKGVSPTDVRGYLTSPQSGIAQRVNSIVAGTNPDRPDAGGGYAALYNPNKIK